MSIECDDKFKYNDYNFFISYDKPKIYTKQEIEEEYKECFKKDYFIRRNKKWKIIF